MFVHSLLESREHFEGFFIMLEGVLWVSSRANFNHSTQQVDTKWEARTLSEKSH